MQLCKAIPICLVLTVLFQVTDHAANTSTPLAYPQTRVMHSPLDPQSKYPNNPIMLESPSNFPLTEELRTQHSIEDYIVGGYNRWGGYENEMFQPDGSVILEFDMKITKEEYSAYYHGDDYSLVQSSPPMDSPLPKRKPGKRRFKRKAMIRENTHWTDGIIPYTISEYFSPQEVEVVKASMKTWQDRTCIRFVPAQAHHHNILKVQSQRGCNSFVGMVGGTQQMNLEKDCRVKHVITHELGHVIGLIHEHQRPDRDIYIRIMSENVGFNKLKNFRKFRSERVSSLGVDYDYTSIMHYGKKAFSKDDRLTTMMTLDTRFQDIIGHATTISFNDAKIVNLMYECAKACKTEREFCGSGYMDRNCQCVCKDGTQSCVNRVPPIVPIRPVAPMRPIHTNQPIYPGGRIFLQKLRPQPVQNIFYPSMQRPIHQTPTLFSNLYQSTAQTNPTQPLYQNIFTVPVQPNVAQRPGTFRNIFLPTQVPAVQSPGTFRNVFLPPAVQRQGQVPGAQSPGTFRNVYIPKGVQRSVTQVPAGQRQVVQPALFPNIFQYPAQMTSQLQRQQRPAYPQYLFVPRYRYHKTPVQQTYRQIPGNQGYYQQPRYQQPPLRRNMYSAQANMVAPRQSHTGGTTNTAYQHTGATSKHASTIHIYPGYLGIPLPPTISSEESFTCSFPQTRQHIPWL